MSTSTVNVVRDNTSVKLPRELRNGEFYCHECGTFVLFKNSELHSKWHRQRSYGIAPKPVQEKVALKNGLALPTKLLTVKTGDNLVISAERTDRDSTHHMPATVKPNSTSLVDLGDGPPCVTCGSIMIRNGSCYVCRDCGTTSGCS